MDRKWSKPGLEVILPATNLKTCTGALLISSAPKTSQTLSRCCSSQPVHLGGFVSRISVVFSIEQGFACDFEKKDFVKRTWKQELLVWKRQTREIPQTPSCFSFLTSILWKLPSHGQFFNHWPSFWKQCEVMEHPPHEVLHKFLRGPDFETWRNVQHTISWIRSQEVDLLPSSPIEIAILLDLQ